MILREVVPGVWRWQTPDPEEDWMMVGHVLKTGAEIVLIDPPLVPNLVPAIRELGEPSAVILTTHYHSRGARVLGNRLRCPVLVPQQADTDYLRSREMTEFVPYGENDRLPAGLRALACTVRVTSPHDPHKTLVLVDEMLLLSEAIRGVFCGDVLVGSPSGVLGCPEGFTDSPNQTQAKASLRAVQATGIAELADTLLPGHGIDIVKNFPGSLTARAS